MSAEPRPLPEAGEAPLPRPEVEPEATERQVRGPAGRPRRGEWAALAAVAALSVGLRVYNLRVPLVDTSDWRQTDTAAIAYFYFHQGIRLLHPQLWHDGPGPDYTQLELQITPAIAATLAHLFGWSDVLLRAVAVGLFSAAVLPLWALVRRHFGPRTALWTCLCYVLLPVGIYFGRVFQPEPAQIFFGLLGLWAVDRWAARPTAGRYALALAALAVGVLAKLPNLMLLPAAGALALQPEFPRWRAVPLRRWLAAGALLATAAGAGAAYTLVQAAVAAHGTKYVNFIVSSLGSSYIAGTQNLGLYVWQEVLGMAVTPAGGLLAVLGVVALARWGPRAAWVAAWSAGVLAYGLVVLRAIRFQYYLMPLLPWFSLLMGAGLDLLTAALPRALPRTLRRVPTLAAAAAVASLLTGGLFQIQGFWGAYLPWYTGGRALDAELPKDAVVLLTGTFNPTLLYYARRHGYRAADLTMSELRADVEGGARYLLDQGGLDPCMGTYLAENFQSEVIGGIVVYILRWPLPPLPDSPDAPPDAVRFPVTGNCLS
jgi:hypothetical protein